MILTCTKCQARFQIPEDRIPPQGSAVRCASCQETYWLFRNGLMQAYALGDPPPTFSNAQANAIASNRSPSGNYDAAPLPPAVARRTPSQHELPTASLPNSLSALAPPAPLHLDDGDGLPNSEESWFDVPASLIRQKLQNAPPPQPNLGPKDSWLELPLEEILPKTTGQVASFQSLPASAPNKPQQDSWFEIPTTSAALSTISLNKNKGIGDSWLDEDLGLPAHLREEKIETDHMPLGFSAQSSGNLGSLSSSGLPAASGFSPMSGPRQAPAQSDGSTNILGLGDDLSSSSHDLPLTLDLDPSNKDLEESEEIFGEALQASLETPLTPPPSLVHGPSATAGIEFFLPDRVQQRQQFWFTVLPILTRSTMVLGLLVLFLWLWGSLLAGNFSQQQLAFARLHSLLGGEQSSWRLQKVKVHLYQRKRAPLVLVSGTIHNITTTSQVEPDLQLIQANHPGAPVSHRLRCCLRFRPETLHGIRTRDQALSLYKQKKAERGRKKIKAHGKKVFHLLWIPRGSLPDFRIRVLPFKKNKKNKAKPKP